MDSNPGGTMLWRSPSVKGLAQATLLAGLWLAGSGLGLAQEAPPGAAGSSPRLIVELAPKDAEPMAPTQPGVIYDADESSGDGSADGAGCPNPDGKSKES